MPGRFQGLEPYPPELDDVAVVQGRERILGAGGCAEIDGGAGAVAQLEMPGEEIRVKVREEDVRDAQAVLRREREVLLDVALRVDDRRSLRLLVADQIGRVREAIQIELFEDHRRRCNLR